MITVRVEVAMRPLEPVATLSMVSRGGNGCEDRVKSIDIDCSPYRETLPVRVLFQIYGPSDIRRNDLYLSYCSYCVMKQLLRGVTR